MQMMSLPFPLALAIGVAAASLLLSLLQNLALRQQRRQLSALESEIEKQSQQLAILQETLRTMGRRLVEQEQRLNTSASVDSSSPQFGDDTETILRLLDEGRSVEQIVEATGLDEVEITLLKQIHETKAQGANPEL